MTRIVSIVGARPNFVKLAPISWALRRRETLEHVIVHTGQHYNRNLSDAFFRTLEIPSPDVNLQVGSGTHAVQTAQVMMKLEPLLMEAAPKLLLTYGDVNSTLAAALVASKLGIRTAHVEAGLRSFDRTMPEEINRIVADALSDLLFVTERSGMENLTREGVAADKVHFVGNVMIDALVKMVPAALEQRQWEKLSLIPGAYGVVTLHRPANVDSSQRMRKLLKAIADIAADCPIVMPVHPRTRSNLEQYGIQPNDPRGRLELIEPLDYLSFLSLLTQARIVLTDSGGVQEETTYLGVPCITLRENTERPVTIELGTNRLVHPQNGDLTAEVKRLLSRPAAKKEPPPLWDGCAAERIVEIIVRFLS